jgi:hypothetical protein
MDDSCSNHCTGVAGRSVKPSLIPRGMADPKAGKASTATDGAGVLVKNAINIAMEDLAEEDRKEVEQQLEEEMVELRRKKLACF